MKITTHNSPMMTMKNLMNQRITLTITPNVSIGQAVVMGGGEMNEERLESKACLIQALKMWLYQERLTPEEVRAIADEVEQALPY